MSNGLLVDGSVYIVVGKKVKKRAERSIPEDIIDPNKCIEDFKKMFPVKNISVSEIQIWVLVLTPYQGS